MKALKQFWRQICGQQPSATVIDEVRFLGDMQKLELNPGDILVLKCEGTIDQNGAARVKRYFDEKVPGHTVLILDNGADLGVLAHKASSAP